MNFDQNGTDSLDQYVLSIILQSSSTKLLLQIQDLEATVVAATPDQSTQPMLAAYDLFNSGPSNYASGSGLPSKKTPDQMSHHSASIPPALINRYFDQGHYLIGRTREELRKLDDHSSALVAEIFAGLTTCIQSGSNKQSVCPSPELLDILFTIDQFALKKAAEMESVTLESVIDSLKSDEVASTIAVILGNVSNSISDHAVVCFLEFVVDVTKKSIWKSVTEASRRNEASSTTMSFRTTVQSVSMARNK